MQEQSEAGPDPFIEDTAALIDSMERTSPSWVEGTNGAATSDVGPPAAAAPTASQQTLDPGLAPAGYSNASRSGNGAAKLAGADLPMVQFDEVRWCPVPSMLHLAHRIALNCDSGLPMKLTHQEDLLSSKFGLLSVLMGHIDKVLPGSAG